MPCSLGNSMLQPMDRPLASRAPRLAASMIPGPPPVMMAKPLLASRRARSRADSYIGSSSFVRAEPKMAMPAPTSARASKPCTNSPMIRSTRQVSPWVNSAWAGARGTGCTCLRRSRSSSSSVLSPDRAVRLRDRFGIKAPSCAALSWPRFLLMSILRLARSQRRRRIHTVAVGSGLNQLSLPAAQVFLSAPFYCRRDRNERGAREPISAHFNEAGHEHLHENLCNPLSDSHWHPGNSGTTGASPVSQHGSALYGTNPADPRRTNGSVQPQWADYAKPEHATIPVLSGPAVPDL